ncbi:Copper metallochaperone bacterial Cox17-like protein [Paramagnetospirillum magnetotacticum MS-1]|uniref:Copper metallochaperone bacterial Cox17-like protein n=1 Tax=Paramagnetospirillum magnetotacticum MS-1 TaxID=272627 RepID=A0A0C2UEZ8_PARME|nr:copper chaperone PCu(A)C [Paramagnetospirillum magnetotacticum]KIM00073.1 Copper metallochaperone bacterial Cox17-like protein [Paramagnetospirillum magnetotacticum MS-1]
MKSIAIAAALFLGLAGQAVAADIEVANPFMRAAPMTGGTGAAFMTIHNHGAADRLVSAQAEISKSVELHTHVKDGDIYRMRKVEALALPEHGSAELKPGGDHIMFIGLNAPVKEGSTVALTLTFEKAGKVVVQVPVQSPGAMAPGGAMPGGMMQHHGHN